MGIRRLGFALGAALVMSLAITSIFYIRITRQQAASRPKTKLVVAAATALQPGTPISADNLTEISWPVNVPLDGLIEKKDDVTGRVLIYALAANEPVLRRDLGASGSLGLAAKIPDGMRATAVKTNEVMNIAGFIFPGSHVDVLVTLRSDYNSANAATRTVLQDVQVLSTGTKIDPDPDGKPENVAVVTLLVTPEQSEKLALAQNQVAQNQGTIHFVLRNNGDSAKPDTPAVGMAQLTGAPEMSATSHSKHAVALKPAAAYIVETLMGNKVTIAKFPATPE